MTAGPAENKVVIAAMYRFARLADYRAMRMPLLTHCAEQGIKGTILLAEEGINATLAGCRQGIDSLLGLLRSDPRLAGLVHTESYADEAPFHRLKVKIKKEIVTMGVPNTDPNVLNGTRVAAEHWNELISDPQVLLIDTRNDYEHGIGTFANAVSPETETFREFPAYAGRELVAAQNKKIAMFCTGGIRCEKATNYLLKLGFEQVYHLDGGILKYLETVEAQASLWQGECFVFDDRVAVNANLKPGKHTLCFACRRPVSEHDRQSVCYETGISCPHCFDKVSNDKKTRLAERQRQVQLADARAERHIGVSFR